MNVSTNLHIESILITFQNAKYYMNYFKNKTVVKTCEDDLSNTILVTKVKVELLHKMAEKSYNQTATDVNFGRHKDLCTLKSDI